MTGQHLHDFDLRLCGHALDNFRHYLGEPTGADWLRRNLSPALVEYVRPKVHQMDDLLLNYDELIELAEAAEEMPMGCRQVWIPHPLLYLLRVFSVREVRMELSQSDGEEWAAACSRFACKLKSRGLSLSDGIEVVRDWLRYLRRLLQAIGAQSFVPYPEGSFATPNAPAPKCHLSIGVDPTDELDSQTALAVRKLRIVIADHDQGMLAPAKSLLRKAGIGNQIGRNALRWLQDRDQYHGFSRRRSPRYGEGRQNER
jgi:hypothetical protein